MGQLRTVASLSSSLLARKGGARPAMRPQGFAMPGMALEDLGWNDMGQPEPAAAPKPAPEPAAPAAAPTVPEPLPPVLLEREALAERIEAPAIVREVSVPTATRLRRETAHAGKAALTLRLDAERHLKLRLAGAVANRSAQQLLQHALDALIDSMPVVDALVAQLPPATVRKR